MTGKKYVIRFLVLTLLMIVTAMMTTGSAVAGDPLKGKGLYDNRCSGCHGIDGLPHVAATPNFSAGEGMMKPDQEILAVVKKGKTVMPGFEGVLTDQEILDIIAHIRTLF